MIGPSRAGLCGALYGALCGIGLLWAGVPSRVEIAAITSQGAGRLTLVDAATMEIRASVPLAGKPAAVAVDGARGRIMAVAVETARLHVFDLAGQSLATHDLPGAPFGLAIRPETGTALVTDWTGQLIEVDPQDGRILTRWKTGAVPSGVAADGNGLIVTADRDADQVSLIDAQGVRVVAVGHHPFGVTLHQGRVFVTNVLSDTVSVIDPGTARVTATIPVGERPYMVAFARGRGFVTNQYGASLTVFDADSLAVVGQVETGDYPEGIAATKDGHLLVANWFSDTVQQIDASAMQVVQTLDLPEGPRAFGAFIAAPVTAP